MRHFIVVILLCLTLSATENGSPQWDGDGDGLGDAVELRMGTNPRCSDTDADGIPDGADSAPLQHADPRAAASPLPPGPLASPISTGRPQAVARIERIGGNPTIVVNGKPFGPITFTFPGRYSVPYLRPFASADMRIFSIYTDGGFSSPSEEGLENLDQQMKVVLEANPDAFVLVRPMYRFTPEAWAKANPDELLAFEDGSTLITQGGVKDGKANYTFPSKEGKPHFTFASEVWKAQVGTALRRLIDHVRSSDYSDHVIGYFIGAGYPTEEWIYAKEEPDYSPAMRNAFRRFLIRRYEGSVSALRKAWNDRIVDFATVCPPSLKECQSPTFGDFWDPVRGSRVTDYFRCHNEVEAEKVEYLSRVVKAATDKKGLCGFWYLNLACINYHDSGHQALEKMLGCPTVDLYGAPPPYENRDLGSDAILRSVTESVKLHGKVWYSNTDTRTHFADPIQNQYGRPDDMAGTLSMLTRDYASLLTRGAQGEWYEMGAWYRGPQILERMCRLQLVGRLGRRHCASLRSGLAVIIDEESLFRSTQPLSFECLERLRTNELSRLGAPVDFYFLGDLADPDMPKYRCYLFLNAFSLDGKRRKMVAEVTGREGTTTVWLYAPGLLDPENTSGTAESRMRALTGIRLKLKPRCRTLAMHPVGAHPLMAGLPSEGALGQWKFKIRCNFGVFPDKPAEPGPVTHSPVVYADDTDATVLARYAETGEASYVVKKVGGTVRLWFGSPAMSAELLRRVLKYAGVHVYDDSNDVIYVSRGFLAVHAAHEAPQVIRFPSSVDVYDLVADRVVAKGVTRLNLNLPRLETGLYYYGRLSEFLPEWEMVKREQAADLGKLAWLWRSMNTSSFVSQSPRKRTFIVCHLPNTV